MNWNKTKGDQHAKKVMSDNPGKEDFVAGLVHFILSCPMWASEFFALYRLRESNKATFSFKLPHNIVANIMLSSLQCYNVV